VEADVRHTQRAALDQAIEEIGRHKVDALVNGLAHDHARNVVCGKQAENELEARNDAIHRHTVGLLWQ